MKPGLETEVPGRARRGLGLCAFAALVPVAGFAAGPDFVSEIQPILERNCVRCHDAEKTKGDLRLDTQAGMMEGGSEDEAVVPGKPDESALITRTHLRPIDEGFMPDEGQALEPEALELLTAWVKAGAPWPEGVTLTEQKPERIKRVALPERAPADAREAAAMLDDILGRENDGSALAATGIIDDTTFLRRATIDLIGRIPTVAEIARYEEWGSDRRAKLVAELLNHERFADRWTVFFADMLRIRSNVTGGNELLAYVNASVEQGKPYDEFVRELISASGRANSNPAVGYILGDSADPMELAAATSQVFLGVRIGCAMCHDHPFDDWEQKDFYDLAAFFGKTRQVRGRNNRSVYTTEGHEMTVLWPPEDQSEGKQRKPVEPVFPFLLAEMEETPHYLTRFEEKRQHAAKAAVADSKESSIDSLLDGVEASPGLPSNPVLEEAKKETEELAVFNDLYRASELRKQLSELITDPRNPYFARAFVNRVWAELIGHGFVEPLDNFSDYSEMRHPSTLEFLAGEFIASGYDLRSLIEIIMLSEAYQRSHLGAEVAVSAREQAEKNFSAAPVRRMLGEVLYDSVVVAGHLGDFKWPAGANLRKVERQVRVPTGEVEVIPAGEPETPSMTMAGRQPAMRSDGYDLESSLDLDFDALLSMEERSEIEAMKKASDARIAAAKMAAMQQDGGPQTRMTFTTKTVVDEVDDNPRFSSAMRMQTPAPPAHFLRVFGQPSRSGLGEFRDESASLRQQLMMLNGRLTHEASRVGTKEPLHRILERDHEGAIIWAYREILTRSPGAGEIAEAHTILKSATTPADGMADLRWALLNSHEFRYLP